MCVCVPSHSAESIVTRTPHDPFPFSTHRGLGLINPSSKFARPQTVLLVLLAPNESPEHLTSHTTARRLNGVAASDAANGEAVMIDRYTPKRHLPTLGQREHSCQRHTAAGTAAPTTTDTGNTVPQRANPTQTAYAHSRKRAEAGRACRKAAPG